MISVHSLVSLSVLLKIIQLQDQNMKIINIHIWYQKLNIYPGIPTFRIADVSKIVTKKNIKSKLFTMA